MDESLVPVTKKFVESPHPGPTKIVKSAVLANSRSFHEKQSVSAMKKMTGSLRVLPVKYQRKDRLT